jgi:Calcineurin-like phosphoesterase
MHASGGRPHDHAVGRARYLAETRDYAGTVHFIGAVMSSLPDCISVLVRLCITTMIFSSTALAESFQWTQYGPSGPEVRVITNEPTCPVARVNGSETAMRVRAAPGGDYPITVCTVLIPADTKSISISDVPVTLPLPEPRRIAVIGDTGCRLMVPFVPPQACNDPSKWPFRRIAEIIARMQPDLVIHVGDYYYREAPCPSQSRGCGDSPSGDTWLVWRADFFAPADSLLKVSPWVFVRGNHEVCGRGGQGWSRTLEPYAFDEVNKCNDDAKPFIVRLPGLILAVMDVSSASAGVEQAQVQVYREQYESLADTTSGPSWILQHIPIWTNKWLAEAAAGMLPENVMLILSGHHHFFRVLNYGPNLPIQIVSGHGGAVLNSGTFGFLILEKQNDGWRLTNYNDLGVSQQSCFLKGRSATCPG